VLPQTACFKYLGIFIDAGLRWSCHAKMPPKSKLMEIGGRCFLGSAYVLFDTTLYRGLIGSVLEYGSVCFTNMARTHMMGWERVQYRALRIALGLMGPTPNCLGVLSGIPPLAERFAYLNFRCLVAALYQLGHPLRERFAVLGMLNMGRCIIGFSSMRVLHAA
jgi:hypothetical protein